MNIKTQVNLWKILIFLELINYQVVTIIFDDFILFKFLRDIVLILIVISFVMRGRTITHDKLGGVILLVLGLLVLAVLNTDSLNAAFVFIRKYASPIILLYTLVYEKALDEKQYIGMLKYLFNLVFGLAVWGVLQAHVLGPEFLIDLGYPTKYSYAYQAITLKDSFYFGNLGIQRVVSTLSNSNVFALILGGTVLAVVLHHREILTKKRDWIKLLVILGAYLLTFSRANILAMLIVGICLIWKYIPKKEYLIVGAVAACCAFFALYLYQDDTGISHKLVNWVISSLTFTESSAAGRSDIWAIGFEAVLDNPLGIGFGKVGSWAITAGSPIAYSCESSYLAMALDMGWAGLFGYLLFLFVLIRQAYVCRQVSRTDSRSVFAVTVYLIINFVFSNHIYDKEAVTIIFFIVGLTLCNLRKADERYHVYETKKRGL